MVSAGAFYNETDPVAAQWLRNLIAAGHIAPGVVDERDIRDILPDELAGFGQCHFFAGIGIWSHALRRAGWPDERPVWTGSCPCQPFSAAGARAGTADERHLWPHWHWLIDQRRPPVVIGEQVASKDGLGWLDLVQTDMEASGYAIGALDLCAAGFGGAHIRQRLYFVGVEDPQLPEGARQRHVGRASVSQQEADGFAGRGVAHGLEPRPDAGVFRGQGTAGRLADGEREQRQWGRASEACDEPGAIERTKRLRDAIGVADTDFDGRQSRVRHDPAPRHGDTTAATGVDDRHGRTHAPLLGRDAADWLFCRDAKWRPVEPGTFPLADAPPARVGRLRAYGNGLDAETATGFCEVVMEMVA